MFHSNRESLFSFEGKRILALFSYTEIRKEDTQQLDSPIDQQMDPQQAIQLDSQQIVQLNPQQAAQLDTQLEPQMPRKITRCLERSLDA